MPRLAVASEGSVKSYTIGFVLSVILTLVAYFAVVEQWFSAGQIVAYIVVLAVIQLAVQLYFFLHLGHEDKPRWNLLIFSFMGLVVGIVVIGSLWIMQNLDYHTMSPHDTDKAIIEDEGIQR